MNKLFVLAKNKETYFIQRLTTEVGEGIEIVNPSLKSSGPFIGKILVRTTGVHGDEDLVWLREHESEVSSINKLTALVRFRQKNTQYVFFEQHAIPCLPWLEVASNSRQNIEEFINESNHLEFLVKPLRGQGGWGIRTFEKLGFADWWSECVFKNDFSYLIQPYIKGARELRLFFIGSDFQICLERTPTQGVAANFLQEGQAGLVDLPSNFKDLMNRLIVLSEADYGAIDFLITGDSAAVLELNVVPGIEQLERITRVNIIQEIINRLLTH
jgi:glutathione synthase/RimK-type ligase-like ATP-grasp enzyme